MRVPKAFAWGLGLLVATTATPFGPASASDPRPRHVLKYRNAFEARFASYAATSADTPRALQPTLDDFTIVGQTDLGLTDFNGDVWVHEDHAYVGNAGDPCNGLGVKVVDVSDPANPVLIGRVAGIPGTSAEDIVVRSVTTPSFTGDLLATGIQRCDYDDTALDDHQFGVDLWDVTDPANPVHFGHLGLMTGGGGTHELDLFQRGSSVYVLSATPWAEWFDPVLTSDVQIIDVTDPAAPIVVGEWGAREEGLVPGPSYGLGAFGFSLGHSARASEDGTQAFVSYWDLGVLTLDITDVTNPALVSRTQYPFDADGDAHSVIPYSVGGREFLLANDEDFDPRSPARILVAGSEPSAAPESSFSKPLWSMPNHRLSGHTVRPRGQGCTADDYAGLRVEGKIAVPKTFLTYDSQDAERRACGERRQDRVASRLGAAAIVHDVISDTVSPQWGGATDVKVPVLYTDHATAIDMVQQGRARLIAQRPSWGFLRVFDGETGEQVATFDDLPFVRTLGGPPGYWTVHNTEVNGDVAYSSWYTHGIVALDLSPLAASPPGDPVLVGQFVPEGAPAPSPFLTDCVPSVWGVFVRPSDDLVFASDMSGGLWIVRPTGDAL